MRDTLLLISADAHVGGRPEHYRAYFEARYRPMIDDLIVEDAAFVARGIAQDRYTAAQLDRMDEGRAIREGGLEGAWDFDRRLKELDREGIAAELLNPGHQYATLPFFSPINKPQPPDVRAAGARAYHRWLADGMAGSGGRLVGTADCGPCGDMAATVREARWVADHGFVAIQPPGGVADPDLPPLGDRHYDPFWSACVETGLVLNAHIGHGLPQADRGAMMAEAPGNRPAFVLPSDGNEEDRVAVRRRNNPNGLRDAGYQVRRFVWQMMLSGVLDRYPALRIVAAEIRADWVPATLAYLDEAFERDTTLMKMRPSEYWARHFFVAPSSPRDYEIAMRHEIGLGQLLLATDYPHPEGTWPNTRNWLRATFAGVPEAEARAILGGNAVKCFNLDGDALRRVADRIGPTVDDILGPEHHVSAELIADFDRRSGYLVPREELDVAKLEATFREDVRDLLPA